MTGKNGWARRGRRIAVSCGLLPALVLGGSFNGGAGRLGAAGGDAGAGMIPPPRGAAPLKPDWVEALLDARATALRSLLEAHDLVSAPPRPPAAGDPANARAWGAAPLKPDWVEALLDARATALRSLLEARDLDRRRK